MVAQTYQTLCENADEPVFKPMDSLLDEQEVADMPRTLDPIWNELFPAEQQRILRALVEQVIVTSDGIDISLHADGLYSVAAELK